MRFIAFSFFTHKKYPSFFYSFNKIISTIGLFTRIDIPSNIFGKQRFSIFLLSSKKNSLIHKPILDACIRIISISTFSKMGRCMNISKMLRPSRSSSFKHRTVHKRSQSFCYPFCIMKSQPSVSHFYKINI